MKTVTRKHVLNGCASFGSGCLAAIAVNGKLLHDDWIKTSLALSIAVAICLVPDERKPIYDFLLLALIALAFGILIWSGVDLIAALWKE